MVNLHSRGSPLYYIHKVLDSAVLSTLCIKKSHLKPFHLHPLETHSIHSTNIYDMGMVNYRNSEPFDNFIHIEISILFNKLDIQ